jgi:mRNA-degrading endonuclease toxin of MazEF toxin-antitoxin module
VLFCNLSTTRTELDSHVHLSIGETGLAEASEAQGENITVVMKRGLIQSKSGLRTLNNSRMREIARAALARMGITPKELV